MFNYTFKITNKIIFEVNNTNYFATSAAVFNHTNTDFNTKDEQVFSMMTIDNATGEILSDTTTYKKKGKGF